MNNPEILEHFSNQPLGPPRDFEQSLRSSFYDKPNGLWVSVRRDNDWLQWCTAEGYGIPDGFNFRHLVHLAPHANLLRISTVEELDNFDNQFGVEILESLQMTTIQWGKVAKIYDGIVIAPYQWARRLSDQCRWYYGWDCASGCIWNASAISHFEMIDPPVFENQTEEENNGPR